MKFIMLGAMGGTKRATSRSQAKERSSIPPLTINYKSERALWQLSLVLAEIADQSRLQESAGFGEEVDATTMLTRLQNAPKPKKESDKFQDVRKKTRAP